MADTADRVFVVGSTVHLTLSITKAGERTPVNPATVELVRMRRVGATVDEVVDTKTYTKVTDGHYILSVPTVGRDPGTYIYLGRLADGPDRVLTFEDRFVLRAPTI